MEIEITPGRCPVDGCTRHIPEACLMCRDHWWMVPKSLRYTVWQQYIGWQEGRYTLGELRDTQRGAVRAVNALLAGRREG